MQAFGSPSRGQALETEQAILSLRREVRSQRRYDHRLSIYDDAARVQHGVIVSELDVADQAEQRKPRKTEPELPPASGSIALREANAS